MKSLPGKHLTSCVCAIAQLKWPEFKTPSIPKFASHMALRETYITSLKLSYTIQRLE